MYTHIHWMVECICIHTYTGWLSVYVYTHTLPHCDLCIYVVWKSYYSDRVEWHFALGDNLERTVYYNGCENCRPLDWDMLKKSGLDHLLSLSPHNKTCKDPYSPQQCYLQHELRDNNNNNNNNNLYSVSSFGTRYRPVLHEALSEAQWQVKTTITN